MKYPKFIKPGDTIGLCAPSLGVTIDPYVTRFISAKAKFADLGYHFIQTPNVTTNDKGQSSSPYDRAKEFTDLWIDENVDIIMSVGGGELMIEILPLIDFEKIKQYPPKYFVGYSDNTFLTFTLTTIADIASVYSHNFPNFGMKWDKQIKSSYQLLSGKNLIQSSFSKYEDTTKKSEDPLIPVKFSKKVNWKGLNDEDVIEFKGRLIGGCLDCLSVLCGTKFDRVQEFSEKYRDDGIVFFFESCELNVFGVARVLVQLISAGWFKHCSGILIGRPLLNDTLMGLSYLEVLQKHLSPLNIPVIYDIDVGHVAPRLSLISGSIVEVKLENHKGTIETKLL